MLLFVRPTNGVYLPPKVLRLKGKSIEEEIAVVQRDMPNFFVEAVTDRRRPGAHRGARSDRAAGKAHPERRGAAVSQPEYKPGQKATVKVKLTDLGGKPFVGSTVLTIYDKSVEYISGGSNVPEIKEFFWKWRRHHYPAHRVEPGPLVLATCCERGEIGMGNLGVFGEQVVEELAKLKDGKGSARAKQAAEQRRRSPPHRWYGRQAASSELDATELTPKGKSDKARYRRASGDERAGTAAQPPAVEPTVRKNFADTAFWAGALDHQQGRHRRGHVRHAREPHRLEDQGLGAWATAPRSARARPRSSPRRT